MNCILVPSRVFKRIRDGVETRVAYLKHLLLNLTKIYIKTRTLGTGESDGLHTGYVTLHFTQGIIPKRLRHCRGRMFCLSSH